MKRHQNQRNCRPPRALWARLLCTPLYLFLASLLVTCSDPAQGPPLGDPPLEDGAGGDALSDADLDAMSDLVDASAPRFSFSGGVQSNRSRHHSSSEHFGFSGRMSTSVHRAGSTSFTFMGGF